MFPFCTADRRFILIFLRLNEKWQSEKKMKLSDDIRYIKGVGEKRAALFHKLGIFQVRDLLYHFPRDYEDRSQTKAVADLTADESVCVKVSLVSGVRNFRGRKGTQIMQANFSDGTGVLKVTWFNAGYLKNTLRSDVTYTLFGKAVKKGPLFEMTNPVLEPPEREGTQSGKILPIYPATAGLSQKNIREAAENILRNLEDYPEEFLPEDLRKKYQLRGLREALFHVHLPERFDDFTSARRRLVFDEFLLLQLGIGSFKKYRQRHSAPAFQDVKCIAEFAAGLPYTLTNAQKRVINEISADLKRNVPMNRLVQGDVGSGKTVVAAAVMFAAAKNGYQAAMMAPTEILAEQHYQSLSRLFAPWGMEVVLLNGSQGAKERREVLEKLRDGTAQMAVGTHALLSDKVAFAHLALAITDEQHRFGVEQRTALAGKNQDTHTLVMTATPIPRTLSLVIYGDLDVSVLDERPPGRKEIKTMAFTEKKRQEIYAFVDAHIQRGRQAYFICPLVEESEVIEAESVTDYVEKVRAALPNCSVAALHGKLKPAEKEEIMRLFAEGKVDILVSTTVVEVGVDVPNANIIVIENAERFGLSQLHQLRGRVGRGREQSYCLLICQSTGGFAVQRMKVMCETNDGFVISEKDLELRGPGEFFGTRQHGIPEMQIGNFFTDMDMLAETQKAAQEILHDDPLLQRPEHAGLHRRVSEKFEQFGSMLN